MSKTDWERVRQMSDEEIDFSDIPPTTPEQMAMAVPLEQIFPEIVWTKRSFRIEYELTTDAGIPNGPPSVVCGQNPPPIGEPQ